MQEAVLGPKRRLRRRNRMSGPGCIAAAPADDRDVAIDPQRTFRLPHHSWCPLTQSGHVPDQHPRLKSVHAYAVLHGLGSSDPSGIDFIVANVDVHMSAEGISRVSKEHVDAKSWVSESLEWSRAAYCRQCSRSGEAGIRAIKKTATHRSHRSSKWQRPPSVGKQSKNKPYQSCRGCSTN